MALLTHGSDLTLSPALGPLVRSGGLAVKPAIAAVAKAGFPAVQLDATLPGIRPRELDRRARQDLRSLLVRRGITASGLDLFIPRRHFTDPAHLDRAMHATLATLELAQDLGGLPVSVGLPVGKMDPALRETILDGAEGRGVPLAVHADDRVDTLTQWIDDIGIPGLGAAIDPAALLAHGRDPAKVAQQLDHRLLVARLADLERGTSPEGSDGDGNASDGGESTRCVVGDGDLDLMQYRIACDLAPKRRGPVVLDLRGVSYPLAAAARAKRAWGAVGFEA